jgi:hypothetical protein
MLAVSPLCDRRAVRGGMTQSQVQDAIEAHCLHCRSAVGSAAGVRKCQLLIGIAGGMFFQAER